ncbi:hypothetical protein BN439_3141 [Erwinia amylovora Ea644]|nr:hypothetical protein BN439_3141 [Erwinia amylovora Ea644]
MKILRTCLKCRPARKAYSLFSAGDNWYIFEQSYGAWKIPDIIHQLILELMLLRRVFNLHEFYFAQKYYESTDTAA